MLTEFTAFCLLFDAEHALFAIGKFLVEIERKSSLSNN